MPALPKNVPILFISPAVSYFAELHTEGKKQSLHNVTKIDFPLIEDNHFHEENLTEGLTQLGEKTLHLIVSDEPFLHHIADFPTDQQKELQSLVGKTISDVFPQKNEPLHVVTIDLAKTARMTTIQISAIPQKDIDTLSKAAQKADVKIKSIIPASFAVKGFVSVDPSLFLLETDNRLLLTSHYIGVDVSEQISLDDTKRLVNELKKIKKTHEASQHIYLAVSPEQAEKLQDPVSEVFPIQPVVPPAVESEPETPEFLKLLTVGYRELLKNSFPYPVFSVNEAVQAEPETVQPAPALAKPTPPVVEKEILAAPKTAVLTEEEEEVREEQTIKKLLNSNLEKETVEVTEHAKVAPSSTKVVVPKKKRSLLSYLWLTLVIAGLISLVSGGIVISQQAFNDQPASPIVESPQPTSAPVTEVTPTPEVTVTPATTPVPAAQVKILVKNATGIAGYAGKQAALLKSAGYTTVGTGNAVDQYDEAIYVMYRTPQFESQQATIEDALDKKLTVKPYTKSEDAAGSYDIIIVLGE